MSARIFKLQLLHKIFLAYLLVILLLTLVLTSISYVSFRHMSGAINDNMFNEEVRNLELLAPALATYYQQHQSWQDFIEQPENWAHFIRRYSHKGKPWQDRSSQGKPDFRNKPDFLFEPNSLLMRPNPPKRMQAHYFASRLSLLDADKNTIIKAENPGEYVYMINIKLSGKAIAWIALSEATFMEKHGNVMLQIQLRRIVFIALLGIGLAALVSFYLARHFTAPIRQLTLQSSRLANRDFSQKISVKSDDEFAELAHSFNQVTEKLAQYEGLQKQWLQDITHELRTPLTVIRGEVEAMNDGVITPSRDNLNALMLDVLRLNQLIDDLHELSVTDNLDLIKDAEFIRLDKLTKSLSDRFRTTFAKRGITVITDFSPAFVMGDSKRIEQVVVNVLENCNKYTNIDGKVWLKVFSTKEQIVIEIEDSGPGVDSEKLSKMFDRLYRLDTHRNREKGGAGLGLSISKNIVLAHKGTIEASEGSNGGLKIRVGFPQNLEL